MEDICVIEISDGKICGKVETSKSGQTLYSFLSIPYAQPPTGNLRFRSPQPCNPWHGVRNAIKEAPICVQEDMLTRKVHGEEDCLYLNVYTSEISAKPLQTPKPVMVWIHGGGFSAGSGNRDLYGADYLVDDGVIVVTVNYRLNVLGFLSLDNEDVPGNMGLKDQVAALHWIQKNIPVFGGDPQNITIFGESAGGASVHYHMLSPLSKGLFHKAIAQSGSALNPWAFSYSNKERAFQLGECLGCNTRDPKRLIEFLLKEDAVRLVESSLKLITKSENVCGLKFPFLPTVEPSSVARDAFLTEHPLHAMKAGRFHNVPLITGLTSHEGMISLRGLQSRHSGWEEYNTRLEDQLPEKLILSKGNNVVDKIRKFYFNNAPISKKNISQFIDTDLYFAEGVHATVKGIALLSSAPLYYYTFKFDGQLALAKQIIDAHGLEGACHTDELQYIFRAYMFDIDVEPDSAEMKTIRRMVKLWTNFAKYGNPTPTVTQDIPVHWTAYNEKNKSCLLIDKDLKMESKRHMNRLEFWEQMYNCKL